ncbi:MAG TPA: DUF5996 family protein [Vicinamibacterales bacterium]|nr:DUF5996 family protein [Vicinamibacterales bacterium]
MPIVDGWPPLPYDAWKDTYATLHMWSQVVGKVALVQAPPINHSWGISLEVTPRGLTTKTLPHGDRSFTIAFDFIEHQLVIQTADGDRRSLPLEPRSVAEFYRTVMATLTEMRLPVRIWPVPVEIPDPIPFEQDTVHHSYDPEAATRFWRVLLQVHRVFTESRVDFVGKSSPSHFFWGSFDLAVTRFSGRTAPPRDGPAFMREAYSHEVISHGFWPGSGPVLEPAFYAYAVPEPDGLKTARVRPAAAFYHTEMSEFILPYEAVRTAASPAAEIAAFIESTYDQAATLAHWDRAALERRRLLS